MHREVVSARFPMAVMIILQGLYGSAWGQETAAHVPEQLPAGHNPSRGLTANQFPKGWAQLPPVKTISGKKVFPFGVYVADDRFELTLAEYSANGVNTILVPWGDAAVDAPLAAKHGLYVIPSVMGVFDRGILADEQRFAQEREAMEQRAREQVEKLMRYPDQCLGIYIFDEPENLLWGPTKDRWTGPDAGAFPDFLKKRVDWAYEVVKKAAPACPVFMCIGWHNMYEQLGSGCDINLPNAYPLCRGPGADYPIQRVTKDARMAAEVIFAGAGRCRTFAYTPQMCGKMRDYRVPTEAEFRYMTYAPITQGAMGIIYYCDYASTRNTNVERRNRLYPMAAEVRFISDYLLGQWKDEQVQMTTRALTKNDPPPVNDSRYKITNVPLPDVSYIFRQCEEGKMLLVVNNTYQTQEITVTIAAESGQKPVYVVGENRPMSVKDGVLHDTCDPIDVHIYLFRPFKVWR